MSERILEHCPRCGAAGLSRPNVNKWVCPQCKFQLYLNTAAAVCALIQDDRGRLLVTVRANDPKKGFWDLPGGFVDPDESAEHAVIREVREELGLRVSSTDYLCSRPNSSYPFRGHHLQNTRSGLCLPSRMARAHF
ncbi:MAG: NUDIX domain-containing protein [Planctomycetes bacterium]|nr:NUDIX domain-containing protein [Planctomycetota bacterium]